MWLAVINKLVNTDIHYCNYNNAYYYYYYYWYLVRIVLQYHSPSISIIHIINTHYNVVLLFLGKPKEKKEKKEKREEVCELLVLLVVDRSSCSTILQNSMLVNELAGTDELEWAERKPALLSYEEDEGRRRCSTD